MKKFLVLLFLPLISFASDLTAYGLPTVPVKTSTLERKAYVVQHYDACKAPITSSEHLTKAALQDNFPRQPFKTDTNLPEEYASTPSDYIKSGYDRGHLSPAEDFAGLEDTMHESFYMSNIVPQAPKNNRVLWRALEMHVRKFVKENDDLYVITGAIYEANPKRIGSGVCVPSYMFKILIDKNNQHSEAFLVPNTNESVSNKFFSYSVPISAVEKASGINFTPQQNGLDKTKITLDISP